MASSLKSVDDLTIDDFVRLPVWRFATGDEAGLDETTVEAVERLPVDDLSGLLVGAPMRLAGGAEVWGMLGNIDVRRADRTEQFLTLSIERAGAWFHLARYFDHDHGARGPEALAEFLGLRLQDVFPIGYDIRRFAVGSADVLSGLVQAQPLRRLSEDELVALALSPREG